MFRHLFKFVVFAALFTGSASVFASQIRIDFSGEFYGSCIDCVGYDTGSLLGTAFTGHIIIPATGTPEPGEYYDGATAYLLDSTEASFELDAADDRFDTSASVAMTAYVRDGECIYSCADRFALFFQSGGYLFEIGFTQNTPGDALVGEAFPTLAELQQLVAMDSGSGNVVGNYFTIGMPGWDGWVQNFDDSDPYSYNLMSADVTAIPVPPAFVLYPTALLMLGWFRRR